jgi:hypothetical protein
VALIERGKNSVVADRFASKASFCTTTGFAEIAIGIIKFMKNATPGPRRNYGIFPLLVT